MPDYQSVLTPFVIGDDREILRTITDLPAGAVLVKAWMTWKINKVSDADPGLFQKVITTTNVPGTGQILDDGAGDGSAVVRFDLTPADSLLVSPNTRTDFDIQVKTDGGKVYTVEVGTVTLIQGVTTAAV